MGPCDTTAVNDDGFISRSTERFRARLRAAITEMSAEVLRAETMPADLRDWQLRRMAELLGVGVCRWCWEPAVHEVSWSDRGPVPTCAAHLQNAKDQAANDGEGDRTDAPHVAMPRHVDDVGRLRGMAAHLRATVPGAAAEASAAMFDRAAEELEAGA